MRAALQGSHHLQWRRGLRGSGLDICHWRRLLGCSCLCGHVHATLLVVSALRLVLSRPRSVVRISECSRGRSEYFVLVRIGSAVLVGIGVLVLQRVDQRVTVVHDGRGHPDVLAFISVLPHERVVMERFIE